jgi:DNA-binding NarL/FixJ family response regulator
VGGDLSEREWEVLELLGEGLATREVAQRLGIGDVTVRRHVTAVVRKLGVADRDAALRLLRQD